MQSASKETSPLVRALTDVLSGAKHVQDLATLLVSEAVRRTLAHVCRDHHLDYASMVAKIEDAVVQECVAMYAPPQPKATCSFVTKAGKPCGRHAVVEGACAAHLDALRERQASALRQDVYAAGASKASIARTDPHAARLKDLSRPRSVNMALPDDVTAML
jgi:hypothetical protein